MIDSVSAGLAKVMPRQLPPTSGKEAVGAPGIVPAPVNVERIKSLPKLVNLASALAEQGPPIDFAKIAQVRQAIALGTYRVEPEKIAEGMMRFAGKAAV
jgi:negative regulator of flagellin synthesis FlgM